MCLENVLKCLKEAAAGEGVAKGKEDRYTKVLRKLLENGLSKCIATQKLNSFGDEELLQSMEWLEEKLEQGVKMEISSFDKYADEGEFSALVCAVFS